MDLLEEWLKKDSKWIERALTDSSYNAYRSRGITKKDSRYVELNKPLLENTDLALLGDSIIKFIYSDYLMDNVKELTIEKSKIESDECLVKKVAKHYDLIKVIRKDYDNKDMPNDYLYEETPGKNNNRHKYIATCLEAIIGAIYKETNDLNEIRKLIISWLDL